MGEIQTKWFLSKKGQTFVVRTALPQDADKVVSFVKTVVAEAPYLLTTEAEFNVTIEQQKQLLQQMLQDNGKLAIVAEHSDEIIGFLDFHNGNRQRTKHQGSFGMSVKYEFRNQGVGKALLTVLIGKHIRGLRKFVLRSLPTIPMRLVCTENLGLWRKGSKQKPSSWKIRDTAT